MLSDPLVLKDSAAADVTFNVSSSLTDPKTNQVTTRRIDASRDPNEPRELVIKTTVTGSGANRVRRISIQGSDTQLSVAGVPSTMTYNVSLVFPLNGLFAQTDLDSLACIVSDVVLSTSGLAVDTTKRAQLLSGQS
jgi:hypothetical protein